MDRIDDFSPKSLYLNLYKGLGIYVLYSLILLFICLLFSKKYYKKLDDIESMSNCHTNHKKPSNICRGFLTDREYLEHMIPHHQVAVDISYMHQKITKSPWMHEILRKLIFNQEMEIILMNKMLKSMPDNITSINMKDEGYVRKYIPTISDFKSPNKLGLTKTYCDPHFFDPNAHMKHMEKMKLTDKMYIEHMIPHHQVAVDMSKVLLKNTKRDFMIYLAYRIIRSQHAEIILLGEFLNKSSYKHYSQLIN